jgi:hypothetical protein
MRNGRDVTLTCLLRRAGARGIADAAIAHQEAMQCSMDCC